jgi:hypothetical protein
MNDEASPVAAKKQGRMWTLRRGAGLGLIASLLFTTSAGLSLPPIAAAANLLAMIDARSPGPRGEGALSNKHAKTAKPGFVPESSIWAPHGKPVPAPPVEAAGPPAGPVADAGGPGGPTGSDHFGSSDGFLDYPGGFPGGAFGGGGGPAGFSPAGGGGVPGGPGGGGGGVITPPAAPVPEAATWALMFAGFGLLGIELRRRRRAALARVSA